jgi:hypothetical protein
VTYSMLRVSDLSAESRALMADARFSTLRGNLYSFADPDLEARYEAESTGVLRLKIYMGVALQLVGVICQLHFVFNPEWCQNSAGGQGTQTWDKQAWHAILMPACAGSGSPLLQQQQALQQALAAGLALQIFVGGGVWCYMLGTFPAARGLEGLGGWLVRAIRYCSFGLAFQRLLFLLMAIYINVSWPLRHWLLVFASVFSISSFVIQALSFSDFVFVYPATLVVCFYALGQHWAPALDAFYLRVLTSALMVGFAAVRTNLISRGIFQLQLIFFIEMKHMREILLDLLPHDLVRKNFTVDGMLKDAGGQGEGGAGVDGMHDCTRLTRLVCPREQRQAVVLAFDVCSFTQLCRQEGDMGMANMMHHIFSSFDAAVKTVDGLFKMDTIGLFPSFAIALLSCLCAACASHPRLPLPSLALPPDAPAEMSEMHLGRHRP